MQNKVRIMLYVSDVMQHAMFWQENFQADIVEEIDLQEGYKNIVLGLAPTIELSLFDKAFITKYSPEVADNVPFLMLYRRDFFELHERMSQAMEIVEVNGTQTFAFPDPDGHYFVVANG